MKTASSSSEPSESEEESTTAISESRKVIRYEDLELAATFLVLSYSIQMGGDLSYDEDNDDKNDDY